MSDIAQLAGVRRPVVSVWRKRHATGEYPFPRPLDEAALRFDAEEVGQWLTESGHGNNPDAVAESAFHSDAMVRVCSAAEDASALLLLHHLSGGPLTDLSTDVAEQVLDEDLVSVLDHRSAVEALALSDLVLDTDHVVEAAFSAQRVLDLLVGTQSGPTGPWRSEALTSGGEFLMDKVVAELLSCGPRSVVPLGVGGLVLLGSCADRMGEDDRPALAVLPSTTATSSGRAAWRRLAAHGANLIRCEESSDGPVLPDGSLALMLRQVVDEPTEFFDEVDRAVLALGPTDVLVVVGPARLMTDRAGSAQRRRLLAPAPGSEAPLRYVARLAKGLSRFGGRRRLALWVFARSAGSGRAWTVVGAHSDCSTDAAECGAIAADVAASITAADVHAHAFRSSAVRASDRFLHLDSLTAEPDHLQPTHGGGQLARVLELDDGLLDGIDLTASPAGPQTVAMGGEAVRDLGRDVQGTRIPEHQIGPPQPGFAVVVGPGEVRDLSRLGTRGIDRLALEEIAPRARLTQPGDVVYVVAGGPAAIVDHDGGHVVQAPARVFRCLDAERDDRQLVPGVVAADIARQPGRSRDSWRLRTVHAVQAPAVAEIARRAVARRQDLLAELRRLDELEEVLMDGLSAGSLTAQIEAANAAEEV